MIVIDRPTLKFLMAGRAITIETKDPSRYRKGRVYALGLNHQSTTCRVEVVKVEQGSIKVRLPQVDTPRLLAKNSQFGYVDVDPNEPVLFQAMHLEPEPVEPGELERLNRRYRERVATLRSHVISSVDELAESASAVEARRLRNLRRIAASL